MKNIIVIQGNERKTKWLWKLGWEIYRIKYANKTRSITKNIGIVENRTSNLYLSFLGKHFATERHTYKRTNIHLQSDIIHMKRIELFFVENKKTSLATFDFQDHLQDFFVCFLHWETLKKTNVKALIFKTLVFRTWHPLILLTCTSRTIRKKFCGIVWERLHVDLRQAWATFFL